MHEMSLISNLLNKIEALAKEQNANQILSVSVKLGALAHISPEHFKEHFEAGTQGSIAEGAKLIVETSNNINDPNAQDILLQSIEVEDN
ncbi:MAG: hydrogenase maturation nickel metallochaperone HypA [Candidatus Melainabacteria bacterium]|nr:hydrogenase maturation nickel metallochaperone HypA [Candidatus Melainabacteria bacterium]